MASMFRLLVCVLVLGIGCKHDKPAATADACAKAVAEGPLGWIADDYPAAISCAKQKRVPVVLDLWAPWCHTCLSMQTTVFLDRSFGKDNTRFVFAKLDTDRDQNAAPLEELAIAAWPTFYVIDSSSEAVLGRFVGSATIAQFHEFLDAGALALNGGADAATSHMLGGDRALAKKDLATAETELAAAFAAAPATWPRRPELLNSLILTKLKRDDFAGCTEVAQQHMTELGNAAVASDFLVTAMTCAEKRKDDAAVKPLREAAVAAWQSLLAESKELSVDDRSDAMASTRETLDKLGDATGAKALAEAQRTLLDDAAAKAATPLAAMTYNWPRAEVYAYLKQPLDLVPALEKSAKDLPTEYDPRARLGWVYLQAKDYANAAKWTDDALTLVYGPRKGRMLSQRAEIAAVQHDAAAEKKYREQAVALYEHLPKGQESPEALSKAKEALAKLTSQPTP
jgi:thiol-disulfide isomerase/thioredoxin